MRIPETFKRRMERFFELMAYSEPSGMYWIDQYGTEMLASPAVHRGLSAQECQPRPCTSPIAFAS